MRRAGIVVVGLASALCGCRSAADVDAPAPPPALARQPDRPAPAPESPIRQASARVRVRADDPEKKDAQKPKEKIDLPTAIQLCTLQNFRLQASAAKIAQAEADLLTASLIPNPTVFADLQLIPLQKANLHNQLGPPQQDVIFTIPVDWLLFGKRAAAMQAQQLGVAVARAGQEDSIRKAVSETVDAFYAVLLAEERIKLAESLQKDAEQLEALTVKQIAAGNATATERTRVRMAVEAAIQAVHGHEFELAVAKAKLRPLIGRSAADPDFDVVGTLEVKAVVPVPELQEAIALAEAHRPDLTSNRHDLARSAANVRLEQRRAKPQVAITPGWSYQYQRRITGFRDGSMLDVGVQFGLPLTDRNQGNIRKAQWQLAEAQYTHQANLADARAEIEVALVSYADAVEDVSEHGDPATLKAALEMARKADTEFQAGQRKLIELLDIRRVTSEQQIRHVEFQAAYWRALNKLNTVVGLSAYDPATAKTTPVEYGKKKDKDKEPKGK